VIDLPDSTILTAALADRRIAAAAAVSALAGLVRGFSGFGGAMIYMPLVAAIYEPRIAAATLLLVDFLSSTPFALPEVRRCTWREVLPISIAMAAAVPIGTWALVVLDPVVLRWGIAVLVLSLVPVLASGWRYRGPDTLPVSIGVGLFAGVGAGAAQIAGPPVIVYWLSRGNPAVTLRANLMVFFMICGVVLVVSYAAQGLFSGHTVALSLLLGIPYLFGVGIGARFFRTATDRLYRRIAYLIIALAALVSLPLFDPLFR
jgi:uncharacterized membrane protein YfcA